MLPMFPLGTVLLPGAVLPLHVFEPRYREMTRVCLDGDREFGVVLIERGSEVGGGDVRSMVGCVAKIIEAEELSDGRFALVAVGTRRIRVVEWLADDPYPLADVEDWPDPHEPDLDVAPLVAALRRSLALAAEAGLNVAPATTEISDNPSEATYEISALTPVGPFDQQQLLAAATAGERAGLLGPMLHDAEALLRERLR